MRDPLTGLPAEFSARSMRWTQNAGAQSLGTLPGNSDAETVATHVSSDGSVVMGSAFLATTVAIEHVFRWTAAASTLSLKTPT